MENNYKIINFFVFGAKKKVLRFLVQIFREYFSIYRFLSKKIPTRATEMEFFYQFGGNWSNFCLIFLLIWRIIFSKVSRCMSMFKEVLIKSFGSAIKFSVIRPNKLLIEHFSKINASINLPYSKNM